jgi:pimeloyl-ACP methyl ester carboxylesterase
MAPGDARTRPDFQVVAVDQRGIGLSDKPPDGCDTGTLARDLVALMEGLGHQRFAVVGFDTGVAIACALAADHRDRVERLVVGEGPLPGVAPLFLPGPLNERLWHIGFNRAAEVNERLVTGREDIHIGNEYAVSAAKPLPDDAVRYYVDILRSHKHALRGGFGWYRALDATIAQEAQRKTRRLTLPVLAIGGQYSGGERVAAGMKLAADDVQTVVIPGAAQLGRRGGAPGAAGRADHLPSPIPQMTVFGRLHLPSLGAPTGATARPSRDPDGITTMLSTSTIPPTNTITATTVTELSSTCSKRRSVFRATG